MIYIDNIDLCNLLIFINLNKFIDEKNISDYSSLTILIWSCSHKTVPAKTETSPTQTTIVTTVSPSIGCTTLGKQTYTARCGRCHELKDPADYTATQWVPS